MIKSKYQTFTFWFIIVFAAFFAFLIISAISQYYFGVDIIKIQLRNHKDFIIQEVSASLGFLMLLSILWFNVKNIIINNTEKTISFQNIFTRHINEYKFSDFDGYIDTFIKHGKGGYPYKTVGFVIGKRVVRRIDSYYYSNYEELRAALTACNYLGEVRFGFWNSLKMMLNYEVLE